MMAGSEKLPHIDLSHFLREDLVFLTGDLVEQLSTADILHDQVDILFINVSLIILHDVWVVQSCQDPHLFLDGLEVVLQLLLVHDFDSHLMLLVVLVESQEDLSESTATQDLSVIVDLVILFQLLCALLLAGFESHIAILIVDSVAVF